MQLQPDRSAGAETSNEGFSASSLLALSRLGLVNSAIDTVTGSSISSTHGGAEKVEEVLTAM